MPPVIRPQSDYDGIALILSIVFCFVLVLIGIVANICVTIHFDKADLERGPRAGRKDLPCPAIPTKCSLEMLAAMSDKAINGQSRLRLARK